MRRICEVYVARKIQPFIFPLTPQQPFNKNLFLRHASKGPCDFFNLCLDLKSSSRPSSLPDLLSDFRFHQPLPSMLGSSRASSFIIIYILLPRSTIAYSTLASRFSTTLSWHFVSMARGILLKQADIMREIMLDNNTYKCVFLSC